MAGICVWPIDIVGSCYFFDACCGSGDTEIMLTVDGLI